MLHGLRGLEHVNVMLAAKIVLKRTQEHALKLLVFSYLNLIIQDRTKMIVLARRLNKIRVKELIKHGANGINVHHVLIETHQRMSLGQKIVSLRLVVHQLEKLKLVIRRLQILLSVKNAKIMTIIVVEQDQTIIQSFTIPNVLIKKKMELHQHFVNVKNLLDETKMDNVPNAMLLDHFHGNAEVYALI